MKGDFNSFEVSWFSLEKNIAGSTFVALGWEVLMVTPSTLWLLIKHSHAPQGEAVWVGERIRLSWQILCYLMTEQVNHEIYIYFIVSRLWKLEIRHKSNLKRQEQHWLGYRGKLLCKLRDKIGVIWKNTFTIYTKFMKIMFILNT